MSRNVKDLVKSAASVHPSPDRRNSRWDQHRAERRGVLVEAAVDAIDRLGPDAGIGDIAASAGVSKPVLYRYFADKEDLYRSVGAWGAQQVIDRLLPVLLSERPLRERVELACAGYFAFVADHPHVFRLLVDNPTNADPLADGKEMVAAAIARTFGDVLRDLGVDAAGAEPWAHGLVGLGLSTAAWWLRRRTMSRAAVSGYLSSFIWHGFEGFLDEHGVRVDDRGRLRLVPGEGRA